MDKVKVIALKAKLELLKELHNGIKLIKAKTGSDELFKEGVSKAVEQVLNDLNELKLTYSEELVDVLITKESITLDLNETGTEDESSP